MKVLTIKEQTEGEIHRLAIHIHAIKIQQPIKYRSLMDTLSYLSERERDRFAWVIEKEIEKMGENK